MASFSQPTPHLHDALFDPIFVPIDAIFGLNKGWRKIKRPQKGLNSLNLTSREDKRISDDLKKMSRAAMRATER